MVIETCACTPSIISFLYAGKSLSSPHNSGFCSKNLYYRCVFFFPRFILLVLFIRTRCAVHYAKTLHLAAALVIPSCLFLIHRLALPSHRPWSFLYSCTHFLIVFIFIYFFSNACVRVFCVLAARRRDNRMNRNPAGKMKRWHNSVED